MSYEPTIWRTGDTVTAEKLNKIEQAIVADNTAIEGKVGRDEFDTEIATLESKVGSPLIASTVSEMTETDRVYVYTGSETGYTSGNWYYYDGTAWTSGGVYNAVAVETDTTLSVSGKAADAKKVGDELADVMEELTHEYIGFRRYLTASDSAIAVPVGVYGISASASAKPSNLPSNFPSSNNGLLIALDKSSGQADYATDYICIANYSRKVWFYTQYEWIEIVNTNMANSLISSAVNNAYKYIYDYLCPDIVHIAKESYTKGSAFSTTNTQYKFLGTSGVEDVATSFPDWYVSNDITVEPFTFYYVTASAKYSGHQLYQFIDSGGNIIGYEAATSSSTLAVSDKLIYSPANAVKIRIASVNGSSGIKLYSATEKRASMKWVGKKWACMGDSLTAENIRTTMHYHDYIAQKTGITVVNLGAGGTGYKREFNNVSGFMDRVDTIPLDSDVVTIFGSGNDNIYTVGDPSDTGTDTLCGCINTTISRIFERITTCQLGIVTPTPWQGFNPADDTNWMSEYSDAIVQICKNWGIPCLDLYHCSNLRPWDADFRAAAYSKDDGGGTHPDETGHALIAPRFEAFLNSLLLS